LQKQWALWRALTTLTEKKSEEQRRRKLEACDREMRNTQQEMICWNLEREEPEFNAKYYCHPSTLKPCSAVFGLDSTKEALEKLCHKQCLCAIFIVRSSRMWEKHSSTNFCSQFKQGWRHTISKVKNHSDAVSKRFETYLCTLSKMKLYIAYRLDWQISVGKITKGVLWILEIVWVVVRKGSIAIVAAASHPWDIDPDILGYFGTRLYVDSPDQTSSSIQIIWDNHIEHASGVCHSLILWESTKELSQEPFWAVQLLR
jgi:hypothetical protein